MWNKPVWVTFMVQPPRGMSITICISLLCQHVDQFLVLNKRLHLTTSGKRIANDYFQQDRCSRNLPFSSIYRKPSWRNPPERQKSHAASLSDFRYDFCS
ncbi:hypothetical protein TNCV_2219501 [Trichonephila clavipes]|nr:hypothetical protein TNCV_2219501 [Trichonephila clavipes]